MKTKTKALILCLCTIALIAVTVLVTIAYLSDTDEVTNTFTVGRVNITLDETAVNADGTPTGSSIRVKGNTYHLIPGQSYTKDPMITVEEGSEKSYIRMLVTINRLAELDAIFAPKGADLLSIFNGYDSTKWVFKTETRNTSNNTITYEFRYFETIDGTDGTLEPLFTSFTLPGDINGKELATLYDAESNTNLQITVIGHAIQEAGFASADDAWTAFNAQTD